MTTTPLGQRPTQQPASRGVKIGAVILVGIVAIACIGGVAAFVFKGGSHSGAPADRSLEAKAMCETFVKQKLKSPGSAKFSNESAAKVSDTEYTSGGSVDSQNALGALLRSTFACDMTYDAASKEWTSKSVSVVPA